MKLNQQLKFFVNNASINKNTIDFLSKKYNIQNPFITQKDELSLFKGLLKKANANLIKEKELWIYLREEQKYSTDSYSRYEKMILKNTENKIASFIALGQQASDFFSTNNIKPLYTFDLNNPNLAKDLSIIVKYLYTTERYSKVNFVINSNKNYNKPFTILPMNDFDLSKLTSFTKEEISQDALANLNIYPSVSEYVDSNANIFIENALQSLIIESSFYNAKNGLVRTNKIIKDLDEEIWKISKRITKIKRENEIEEIVLLTKNNNEFSLMKKGEN
nr:hypothetical protein [Mycoplasma procyoni]